MTTTNRKTTKKPGHASARTAAGERARKEAIAIAQANIDRIEAAEADAARHSPAHAARVANGEIRLGKDATKPKDATRASDGPNPHLVGRRDPANAKPAKAPKTPKEAKPAKEPKSKRVSGLDLAAKVLADAGEPLAAKAIAERAIAAGWTTSGKTPHATLYAAIIREIASKGDAARFKKTDRGMFTAAGTNAKKGA